jgi:S-(hydroxymethyl)glutathione dehydrogenase/alcohol dehydrogenase
MDRREALTGAVAAVATLGAAANAGAASGSKGAAKAASAGRTFQAWVHGAELKIETLRLLPLGPRSVLVRPEAAQCSYTTAIEFLSPQPVDPPRIAGQGCVGRVVEIGSQVTRVQVGDRVIMTQSPQCGRCYNCLQDRGDMCELKQTAMIPVAERADGTQVVAMDNIGGYAELNVCYEDSLVRVSSSLPASELVVLQATGSAGLAATITFVPVAAGKNVAVVGCGPLGLSAVQGARIMGAAQIIAIEPIAYRRELAARLGATVTLDPNAEGDHLVERVAELCHGTNDLILGGGKDWTSPRRRPLGADFVIEAAGSNSIPPKAGGGPDPTGVNIKALQFAWQMTHATGHLVTTGLYRGEVSFPASDWTIRGRTHHAGQLGGGANIQRDIPRFIALMEKGLYDAKPLVTMTVGMADIKEAFQAVADRTTLGAIVAFAAK